MNLTLLIWNIWLDNQIKGKDASARLLNELERIINLYKPDCIGLNEVLKHKSDAAPFVLDYLRSHGYKYGHYAVDSPLNDEWSIGSAFVSKLNLDEVQSIKLNKDSSGAKRGYHGNDTKGIKASVVMANDEKVDVVIAHPLYLRPHTIKEHYKGTLSLKKLVKEDSFKDNFIIAGDFNEPRFMPKSFRKATSEVLNFKSGSLFNATWRHNASFFTPIRANLDQLYWPKDGMLKLERFKVIKSKVSDHKPLVATFTLQENAA